MYGRILVVSLALSLIAFSHAGAWGFFGHKLINRLAVFSLPPEIFAFYRHNIFYLTRQAVKPDQRRYAVESEGPMHYIDMDMYPDTLLGKWALRSRFFDSIPEDFWMEHGALPHRINQYSHQLTLAFRDINTAEILRLSAELGHYVGDAHVPLHTTANYDGQLSGQHGIHGLWESRLPELFADSYDLTVRNAVYLENINQEVWKVIYSSNALVDSVLALESHVAGKFGDQIRAYDERGNAVAYQFSRDFSRAYHHSLREMVERRLCASIALTADIWYTCWVNAGQPQLPTTIMNVSDTVSVIGTTGRSPRNRLH